jgi:hypothetical protein
MPNPLLCASVSSASGGVAPCDAGPRAGSAIPVRAEPFSPSREAEVPREVRTRSSPPCGRAEWSCVRPDQPKLVIPEGLIKKPFPVVTTTQESPATAEAQRKRPMVTDLPY